MWKEMKNKSLCEFLPHCVTQSVVWSSDDSPSSFSLDPTERSKLLLNYLLPSLPAYSLLALCVCIYVQCCHTECVFKWPCVCVCVRAYCVLSAPAAALPVPPASARKGVTLKHRASVVTEDWSIRTN